jgi:hypothetical protein
MKALFTLSTNLIPVMDFEKQFMAASGTTLDQARFSMAFIGALISGALIRWLPRGNGESVCCIRAMTGLVCCSTWHTGRVMAGAVGSGPQHNLPICCSQVAKPDHFTLRCICFQLKCSHTFNIWLGWCLPSLQ